MPLRPGSGEITDNRAETAGITVSWDAPSHAGLMRIYGYVEGDALRVPCNKWLDLMIAKRSSRLITDSRDMKALLEDKRYERHWPFWTNIKDGLDRFEQTRRLSAVSVDWRGRYTFR